MSSEHAWLETQIDEWLNAEIVGHCTGISDDRVEELHDHLMCVAEDAIEQGKSAEAALQYALEQFGSASQIRDQLRLERPAFRRWLWRGHCARATRPASDSQTVALSLVVAAALLVTAWFAQSDKAYALLSTCLIGVWVVITARHGGTRQAARAEWRWLKRKLGA